MRLMPTTKSKLDYTAAMLAKEFSHLPREHVVRELETVAERILDGARFDDYVPVLAYRFARERLRERTVEHFSYLDAA